MPVCFRCNKSIDTLHIGRTDTCPVCNADLHCCMNCRYYDEGAYNQCRETQAERVIDKDRSNFCDFFSPREQHMFKYFTTHTSQKANPLDGLFKTKKAKCNNESINKDEP